MHEQDYVVDRPYYSYIHSSSKTDKTQICVTPNQMLCILSKWLFPFLGKSRINTI